MIMASNKVKGLELDVRSGSFCIYRKDTFESVSSGNVDGAAFGGDHEKMTKFAMDKFDSLCGRDLDNDN